MSKAEAAAQQEMPATLSRWRDGSRLCQTNCLPLRSRLQIDDDDDMLGALASAGFVHRLPNFKIDFYMTKLNS